MSLAKTILKKTREQITAKDWPKAASSAREILSYEPSNYNALVFLALALANLKEYKESEEIYVRATTEHSELPLAFQGLAKLYEDTEQWDKLADLCDKLMHQAKDRNDPMKLAEYFQKLLTLRRAYGNPTEVAATLSLILPTSDFYDVLSALPDPEPTKPSPIHSVQLLIQNSLPALEEIVYITELQEASEIAQETDRRRMRLTGKVQTAEESKKSVQCDLMGASKLPSLYSQILAHPYAPDPLRRFTESKLLFHFYTYLLSVPSYLNPAASIQSGVADKEVQSKTKLKKKLRERTTTLAADMVLLKVPDLLAWSIKLNWKDVDGVQDYDLYDLRRLLEIFPPEEPLAKLAYVIVSEEDAKKEVPPEEAAQKGVPPEEDKQPRIDKGQQMRESLEQLSDSLFAHVVAAEYYLGIKDFQSLRNVCEAGQHVLQTCEDQLGSRLPKSQRLLDCYLAAAYVHVDAPLHHRKALRLLNSILQDEPENASATLSKGLIMSAAGAWSDALELFEHVLANKTPSDDISLDARSERAWCLVGLRRLDEAEKELEQILDTLYQQSLDQEEAMERLAEVKGKTWWRLGRCFWESGGDRRELPEFAYTSFTESIRICPTFAPSFTWLGKYYAEVASDRDQAMRLFQKALDLDAREEEAGQILADLYAQNEEWSAVEMVARRVVSVAAASSNSETALSGTLILQKYSWAWRAIGMADIKSARFESALTALQRSLRGNADDGTAWLQLGIAYRGSGKHIAALKAFGRVVELQPEEWAAYYLAGDIQRSIGLLDAATANFNHVLKLRPNDLGIQIVLAETLLLQARVHMQNGLLARAIDTLIATLEPSMAIIEGKVGAASATKVLADGLLELSAIPLASHDDDESLIDVLHRAQELVLREIVEDSLPSLAPGFSPNFDLASASLSQRIGYISVIAYKLTLLFEPPESSTQATAWADLGIAVFRQRKVLKELRPEYTDEEILRWSVHCLREALRAEPRNPNFWNALGVVSFRLSPRLAQHSFIRSSEYNQRSAIPWTHLGLFYLDQSQPELANQAFSRAQVLDPEWPNVWLGQACLAALHGDEAERRGLVTHAWKLAVGSVPLADLEYAKLSVATDIPHYPRPSTISAAQSVRRYLNHAPTDAQAQSLLGTLAERNETRQEASAAYEAASRLYESRYELREDEADAKLFVQNKAAQGRALLAEHELPEAQTSLETALGLVGETLEDAPLRIEALLHLGIAQWQQGQHTNSIATLRNGKDISEQFGLANWNAKTTLVLARCLRLRGDEEGRASANDMLLACVSDAQTSKPNLEVITTLAAWAILDDDQDMLDAAISEIQELPVDERAALDPKGDVAQLLITHHLLQGSVDQAIQVAETDVFANPSSLGPRKKLASLLIKADRKAQAREVLAALTSEARADPELAGLAVDAAEDDGPETKVEQSRQMAFFLDPVGNAGYANRWAR